MPLNMLFTYGMTLSNGNIDHSFGIQMKIMQEGVPTVSWVMVMKWTMIMNSSMMLTFSWI